MKTVQKISVRKGHCLLEPNNYFERWGKFVSQKPVLFARSPKSEISSKIKNLTLPVLFFFIQEYNFSKIESVEFCSLPARNQILSSVFSNSSNRCFSWFACILHFSFNRKSSFYFSNVWPIFGFFEAFFRKFLPVFISSSTSFSSQIFLSFSLHNLASFFKTSPLFLLHSLCESIFAFFSLLFPDLPISSSFSPMFSNWIYSLQSSIILLSCTTRKFRDRSLRSSKSSFFMLVSTLSQNRTKLTSTSELNIALYFAKNWLKYCVKHALESQPKKWHILVTHTWRALTYLQYQDALVKFRWLRLMKPTKC